MWRALHECSIQIVSTDHCPWTRKEKQRASFADVPGGLPGIEARLSLVHSFGVKERDLPLTAWVSACCTAPARRMGLTRKGALLPGCDADIVIFDPHREMTIRSEDLNEAADWTPYEGVSITGWPRTVLLRGAQIVRDERFVGRPGQGRYVPRNLQS